MAIGDLIDYKTIFFIRKYILSLYNVGLPLTHKFKNMPRILFDMRLFLIPSQVCNPCHKIINFNKHVERCNYLELVHRF